MLNQNGINNVKDNQEKNETIDNLNPNLIPENEKTHTLTEKPSLAIEDEIKDDAFYEEEVKKTNLVFYEKGISPFKLYLHLSKSYEIFLMVLEVICVLGAGVAAPLMCYLFGDMANDFSGANVDEDQMDLLEALMKCKNEEQAAALAGGNADRAWSYVVIYRKAKQMFELFDDNVDSLVRKLLIIGTSMFVAFGGQKFFWCYCGMRQMHHLKEKYFAVILRQEQGWFDANNAFEFSTKVQAQFEQIALGVGEKFGLLLHAVSQIIVGIIIAFYKSWLITLVMLALSPTIFLYVILLVFLIKKHVIGSRKTYEKAGGAAEEMLYNIKTIVSFSSFEFEIDRFNRLINIVHYFDRKKAFILGATVGAGLFLIYLTFFVATVYATKLIGDEVWNDNRCAPFTLGDIVTGVFLTLVVVLSVGFTAPTLKIIQESAIASSDYFTLYEREPQMDFSQSVEKPPRDQIKGKIDFKNVNFYYPPISK